MLRSLHLLLLRVLLLAIAAPAVGCSVHREGMLIDGGDDLGVPVADLGGSDASPPELDGGEPDLGPVDIDGGPIDLCVAAACPGHFCVSGACGYAHSCAELLDVGDSPMDGVYTIDGDGSGGLEPANAYCDMTEDDGGWTLVLKANGAIGTFGYDAAYWTDAMELGDSPTLDDVEAKLRAFRNVRFTQMRVVLVTGSEKRSVVLEVSADSCMELFGGGYTSTALSRETWLTMVPDPSLQSNCGQQGINVAPKADWMRVRIGIIGNNENNCNSADSRIGVGGAAYDDVTVGNVARFNGGGNDRDTVSFAYVFVR